MAKPIHNWHIIIGGFTQREGDPTGMVDMWLDLHRKHASTETMVVHRTWHSNWSELAESIWLTKKMVKWRQTIKIYAYSWGGGWGFTRLAEELRKRGLRVEAAVLCDPVYCSPWLSMRWLAMTRWRQIPVPANVRRVTWFYQRQNWPQSQGLYAVDPQATVIAEPVQLDCTHHYADEAFEFLQAARLEAAKL